MEMVYIEPDGGYRGLNIELAGDSTEKTALDLLDYGAHMKKLGDRFIPAMTWEAFERAQRDCFRAYYIRACLALGSFQNVVTRDKTIVANLMRLGFDCLHPVTGSKMIEDASPQGMELFLDGTPSEVNDYTFLVRDSAKEYLHRTQEKTLELNLPVSSDEVNAYHVTPFSNMVSSRPGFSLFRLPTPSECRAFDKMAVKRLLDRGATINQARECVSMFSPMAIYWNSYVIIQRKAKHGDKHYACGLVAEVLAEGRYTDRMQTAWGKAVSEMVEKTMLWDGMNESTAVPCFILGKTADGMIEVAVDNQDDRAATENVDGLIHRAPPELVLVWPKEGASVSQLEDLGLTTRKLPS